VFSPAAATAAAGAGASGAVGTGSADVDDVEDDAALNPARQFSPLIFANEDLSGEDADSGD
jgi:hypothetical protein